MEATNEAIEQLPGANDEFAHGVMGSWVQESEIVSYQQLDLEFV